VELCVVNIIENDDHKNKKGRIHHEARLARNFTLPLPGHLFQMQPRWHLLTKVLMGAEAVTGREGKPQSQLKKTLC
jgi:hypothetical protein